MIIDGCPHDFATLTTKVLPSHLQSLTLAMRSPTPLSEFAERKKGVRSLLKARGLSTDFSGSYIFIEDSKPLYVGISRTVFGRLRSHVYGDTHTSATLAFRMADAAAAKALGANQATTRDAAMRDTTFKALFRQKRSELHKFTVAWTLIDNPVELYVFEVFAAMHFETGQWNTFETH